MQYWRCCKIIHVDKGCLNTVCGMEWGGYKLVWKGVCGGWFWFSGEQLNFSSQLFLLTALPYWFLPVTHVWSEYAHYTFLFIFLS